MPRENNIMADPTNEFSRLFWAARKEQSQLKEKVTTERSYHKAAVEFAKSQGWKWAETLLEGSRLERAKEYEKSLELLTGCASSVPSQWRGLLNFLLGVSLNCMGKNDEAIKVLREALNDPKFDNPGYAWNCLGNALADNGELDEAIDAYHKALNYPEYDKHGDSWSNIGIVLGEQGKYDEAIQVFHTALSDPKKISKPGYAWINLATVLAKKGEYDEAIKAHHKALEDPKYDKSGDAWNILGLILYSKGEYDEAIKACHKALEDPKYDSPGNAWSNLGLALVSKGEYDEAFKAYYKALEDPKYNRPGNTWNNLGLALVEKGEYDKAITAYYKALEHPKHNQPGNTWHNIGLALHFKGEYDEAIKAYHKALEDPKYDNPGNAWHNIGVALSTQGKLNDAIQAYRKALGIIKVDFQAKAWNNLAQAYISTGNPEEAKNAFNKALEISDSKSDDHARARLGLQLLNSNIKVDSLKPDDRAMAEKTSFASQTELIESKIIAAIKNAGDTQYDKYISQPDSGRDNTLSILRGWSSSVTLLEGSERRWRGGGYFLKWQGYGLVIDPGFDFLRNFHDADYHGREINAVIISHNHPDHNSDLKDIDDLRYEIFKRELSENSKYQPYVLLWDQDTHGVTKFNVENPKHRHEPVILSHGYPQPINLNQHSCKIPIRITPFNVKHVDDASNAVGMLIELFDKQGNPTVRIGYTSDTSYFPDLHKHLISCDIVIAHISQPSIDELSDATKYKAEHLGYRGTIQLLKECKPKLALIGEFWAGFTDLRISLVKGLRQRSGIEAILPAGLGMHIKLPTLDIECTECKTPIPFSQIKVTPPVNDFGGLAYLCPRCVI